MYKVALFATAVFMSSSHVYAMEAEERNSPSLFTQKGPLKLTLEETLPANLSDKEGALNLLKSATLELVKTDAPSSVQTSGKSDVGYTFPNTAPWCLLTAKYIKETSESSGNRVSVGDWGCGHGFFSRHAVISGGNPYAIEIQNTAAQEANKNIYGVRKYLSKDLDIKELYTAFHGSVTKPHEGFMRRKNNINVAFNILHHLKPKDADLLLKNMFENTAPGGFIVISTDTPFKYPQDAHYYNESFKMGLKYPGFGLYNTSNIAFKSNPNQTSKTNLSVHRPSEDEIDKLTMGYSYLGSYPKNDLLDDTKTLLVEDPTGKAQGNILKSKESYYYRNSYQLINQFDYLALKDVVESAGFTALNGWYTDHIRDTLYPHDMDVSPSLCRKTKVVIVAKKK